MVPPVCFGGKVAWKRGHLEKTELVVMRKNVAGLSEASLRKFVLRAARAAGLRGSVSVLVTTNQEMQSLNRQFRGKDKPTDVLSFPAVAGLPVQLLGDIAISANIAAQNAKQLGHSAKDEIRILVLHGVLHLAGYDHEQDHGAMALKEMRLRKQLGLPIGLMERTNGRTRNGKVRKAPPRRSQGTIPRARGARK